MIYETTMNSKKIRTLSLFSGGGGLDVGFEQAGFEVLFSTDIETSCCNTLRMNKSITLSKDLEVLQADIRTLNLDLLPNDIDMVIGGPPCQSFSASGRRAGGAAGSLDARGTLFEGYCKVISKVQPKAFLFENVRGILATNKGKDFNDIIEAFEKLKYKIDYRILDAEDYGVPQQRERLFIVGHRMEQLFLFPKPIYGPDSKDKHPYLSVHETIKDLQFTSEDEKDTAFINGKYSYLLPLVPPGENYLHFTEKRGYSNPIFAYRSRFSDFLYKADPNIPVKTLIASPGKYTGPFHWDNRYLTVNEYKRIQGFPDEHTFWGKREDQIKQIGNSVCPKIAFYIALAVRQQIFGQDTSIDLLQPDIKLSFDKRKGQKAKKTKEKHAEIKENNLQSSETSFSLKSYTDYVEPTSCSKHNVKVKLKNTNEVEICVQSDDTKKLQAKLSMSIYGNPNLISKVNLNVSLYGQSEYGIQTMWNAVDNWVQKTSNYHSLIELYGHFTEPHPIFNINKFVSYSKMP
ncbi:MAG: hypothetical protein K0Q87_4922, partial [Neobacillus sp.]|nr:hypothetical protein [Neobacillus sp.]